MFASTVENSSSVRIIELTLTAMSVGVIAFALRIVQDLVMLVVGQVRLSQGRCSRCAYDLRGNISGVCPECGKRTMVERGGTVAMDTGMDTKYP